MTFPSLPTLPPSPADGFRLSPQQLQAIADAQHRASKIRRAIAVAKFDGWATAVFAGLTLISGLFGWIGLVLGAGMAVVALVEFRGARRLRQLDPTVTCSLGLNQIFFGGLLLSYAIYSLWGVYHQRSPLLDQLNASPELGGLMIDARELAQRVGVLVYGTLAAVAIFGQGGTALYYFSRRKHIDAYLGETPQWIVDAQRAGLPM